jgi:hypothetical protein
MRCSLLIESQTKETVSAVPANPKPQRSHEEQWARLIPGEVPFPDVVHHPPSQLRAFTSDAQTDFCAHPTHPLSRCLRRVLIPLPLQTRTALSWLCSTAADFALVGLNWLLAGSLLVGARELSGVPTLFSDELGSPASLIGMALLQAALI